MINKTTRTISLTAFVLLAALSLFYLFQLKFAFDLEQFFPEGDEDLVFFQEFTKEFEKDDNFLLVAVQRSEGVFEQKFLEKFHELSIQSKQLPHVVETQSLTKLEYPLKTPFGITAIPAIHIDKAHKYEKDKARILNDERFVYNLISEDATAIVLLLKTIDNIQQNQGKELINALNALMETYDFENYHYTGRAYFQVELVRMQQREVATSALISGILVSIVMFLTFRRFWGVLIALVSIGLGMLLFFGLLGAFGRELNAMSALYPVLMIIVGTSDVVHIMSKYVDELRKGNPKKLALRTTIKQIGLATLLTSTTTAIGFASLMTSKVVPIRDFGLNAAIGVMVAYVTVIFFTTACLSFFTKEQLVKTGKGQAFWSKWMRYIHNYTRYNSLKIVLGTIVLLVITLIGVGKITTNYNIVGNLPTGEKVTEDFFFFEEHFSGFRPMEFAIFAKNNQKADDFKVLQEIDKIEQHLHTYEPIRAITSITALYKSIHQMHNGNRQSAYQLPDSERKLEQYKRVASKLPAQSFNVLMSKDSSKARIASRILDIGADTVQHIGDRIDTWIAQNTDSTLIEVKRTGTGMLFDKNANYIRRNLLEGLAIAIIIVSLLMVLLFRNLKMLFISIVPNLLPLLLAGAFLGYAGIELEAGVAIVFAIIFGIAVDDTIHFLSKFKLARMEGKSVEAALEVTFVETGKAITLTTIVLFFGFLVMLFSAHPPSVRIGVLISLTLFSALICDFLLIPVLIRWLIKDDKEEQNK